MATLLLVGMSCNKILKQSNLFRYFSLGNQMEPVARTAALALAPHRGGTKPALAAWLVSPARLVSATTVPSEPL